MREISIKRIAAAQRATSISGEGGGGGSGGGAKTTTEAPSTSGAGSSGIPDSSFTTSSTTEGKDRSPIFKDQRKDLTLLIGGKGLRCQRGGGVLKCFLLGIGDCQKFVPGARALYDRTFYLSLYSVTKKLSN